MHSTRTRRRALALLAEGRSISDVGRTLGVHRSTVRAWVVAAGTGGPGLERGGSGCPWCDDAPLDETAYAALLGFYLGDGCVSRLRRCYSLRISCDDVWPGVITDVSAVVGRVHPARRVFHVAAPGCTVVQSSWQHWPCLLPQHGPGRKHERPIALEPWQERIVEADPAPFLRGLFHSDGSRVRNWASRTVDGVEKRYRYPRWQFVNRSADIRELCCWALDLADVAWRPSNRYTISVSRREAVARLDGLIGPKS